MVQNYSPNNFGSLRCQLLVVDVDICTWDLHCYFHGDERDVVDGPHNHSRSLLGYPGVWFHIIPLLIYDLLIRAALSPSASLHWIWWPAVSLAGDHLAHLKGKKFLFLFLQTDLIQPMAVKSLFDAMKIVGGYSQERRHQHLQLDKVRNNIKLYH